MNAIEAKRLTKETKSTPTITKYIRTIDREITNAAKQGLCVAVTERMRWEYVIKLKEYYRSQGFIVSKHNTTELDNAPYTVGYLTISWMDDHDDW